MIARPHTASSRFQAVFGSLAAVSLCSSLPSACLPLDSLSEYSGGPPSATGVVGTADAVSDGAAVDQTQVVVGEPASVGAAPSSGSTAVVVAPRCPGTNELTCEVTPGAGPVVASGGRSSPDGGGTSVVTSDAGNAEGSPTAERCAADERELASGRCVFVNPALLSWSDARTVCRARGASWDLIALKSVDVNGAVSALLSAESWIGASDAAVEGTWTWVADGTPFWQGDGESGAPVAAAFFSWASGGEPNGGASSDCLRLRSTGVWADLECDERRASVCEGAPTQPS